MIQISKIRKIFLIKEKQNTCTVFFGLREGPGYSSEYMSVRNIELIKVDFPKPASPKKDFYFLENWWKTVNSRNNVEKL